MRTLAMHMPTEQEIQQIVEAVVKRLGGAGVPASAGPGAGAATSATTAAHSCSCTGKSGSSSSGSGSCGCESPAPSDKPARTSEEQTGREIVNRGACRIGSGGNTMACNDLAQYIDHTLLKANATEAEVEKLCHEARQNKFASVCVNTSYVDLCVRLLAGSGVKVCCVVGFPLGAMTSESKAFETRDAVSRGADEIDMVINVGKLASGAYDYVYEDIRAVVRAALSNPVKVILETSLLNEDQKIAACVLAKAAGAHFVKTSTGFSTGGATAEDIGLMRRIVGDAMGVKASGGIRDCTTAQQMVSSGATRLGASASVSIVRGGESKGGY